MVRRIISKIRRFIEIRRLLMLLNDNLIKFCIFEKNYTHLEGAAFFWTQCRMYCVRVKKLYA